MAVVHRCAYPGKSCLVVPGDTNDEDLAMAGKLAPTLPKMNSDWMAARNSDSGWPQFLDGVYVDGLRGWKDQWVEFRFPALQS